MSVNIGIIGMPQSGKTTLFHALTRLDEGKRQTPSQKPNLARVSVPDTRLYKLSDIFKPKKTTPATVDFLDVAASGAETEEKGALGKRVLGSFRTMDTLLEVVRGFSHPYLGEPRAAADLESLELELLISDLTVIQNTLERNKKMPAPARAWFESVAKPLEDGVRPPLEQLTTVPEAAQPFVQSMALLIAKPSIVCANIAESNLGQADVAPDARGYAETRERQFFSVCAKIEEELAQMSPQEAQEFMEALGIEESGLDKMVRASYRSLRLMTFFTVGEDECRAWTAPLDATAPQAAGKIHTDLEKGFIRAEVVSYDDFMKHPSMAACRDNGVLRLEGKGYIVQDGDILNIRFNV